MLLPRVMPCLLLLEAGLVKTVRFKDPRYVGDPINAVRIFNEKEVDELIFLDIGASASGAPPPFQLIAEIAGECFMPLTYGGGVRTLEDAQRLFAIGVEKVSINSAAIERPDLVSEVATESGSQSVVGAMDVAKPRFSKHEVMTDRGRRRTGIDPVTHAVRLVEAGAGELLVNSVNRDGSGSGYDVDMVRQIADAVPVPVVACGGAGEVGHLVTVVREGHAAAAAAGSMFVFHGRHRAVLINVPSPAVLDAAFAGEP